MRRTARAIRAYNPIHSQFGEYVNKPIRYLIEDIMEKDSRESYFIQICDFVSYFAHLYYKTHNKKETLPNRVAQLIDSDFVGRVMATFHVNGILNLKASSNKQSITKRILRFSCRITLRWNLWPPLPPPICASV